MHHKRLVVDANILIRAVLGNRVRNLLEKYCENVAFYVAEANAEEASYYLSNVLAAKHNLNSDLCRSVLDGVLTIVQLRRTRLMDANVASYYLTVNVKLKPVIY